MSRPPSKSLIRRLAAFHRWAGFLACLFVLGMSVSGVILNHSVALDLDRKFVKWPWLLEWYGLGPEGEPVGYQTGDRWMVSWSGETFLNGESVAQGSELIGAGRLGKEIAAVFPREILLFDEQGGLLEEMGDAILADAEIHRAGTSGKGRLVIESGDERYLVENARTERIGPDQKVDWFRASPLPAPERQRVRQAFGGEGLPLYRILLDLHSGKFFKSVGVFVYDAAAGLFVLLAASGIWLGIVNRNRPRNFQ